MKHEGLRDIQNQDYLNFISGFYISFAVNKPKKYPKRPFLEKIGEKRQVMMSPEQMERVAKRIAEGQNIKKEKDEPNNS